MKYLPLILSGLLVSHLAAAPAVSIRGIVTGDSESVTLDLVADIIPGLALRSFGLAISFDTDQLTPTSLGRYDSLWFLSPDGGTTKLPYSEAAAIKPGVIEISGARFDGIAPTDGVAGQNVLLGTISFDKNNNDPLAFNLSLAKAEPFANFTLSDGTPVDGNLAGLGSLPFTLIPAPVDADNDTLPDAYEVATFGSTKMATGGEDSDNDGRSNYQEWLVGTDPTDPDSKLKLIMTEQPDGSKIFEWNGQPGRVYTLQRTDSLQEYRPVLGPVPGTGSQQIIEPADSALRAFYRLCVETPIGQ